MSPTDRAELCDNCTSCVAVLFSTDYMKLDQKGVVKTIHDAVRIGELVDTLIIGLLKCMVFHDKKMHTKTRSMYVPGE